MKFIHTADIHLDSPLSGLAAYKDAPADLLRTVTRDAFTWLVDEAIEEAVDFMVIAGDLYEALLSNLGVKGVEISGSIVKRYEKLLAGGIWCIVSMSYFYEENQKGSPFGITEIKPIQLPNTDLERFFEGRRGFTEEQWLDVLIRSTGMEPTVLESHVKWHLLARMIPLVENFVSVKEQGGGGLIPEGQMRPGTLHTIARGALGLQGLYRLETQVIAGNGKLSMSGVGSSQHGKEPIKVAYDYFKANLSRVSGSAKPMEHDFHLHIVELHNTGPTDAMTLPSFVAFCSGLLGKAVQGQLVVLGGMSLGGSIVPVENLAETLQMAFDSGAKRILIPMSSVGDIPTVPGELFAKFQTSFYSDPVDAVFKALGVD